MGFRYHKRLEHTYTWPIKPQRTVSKNSSTIVTQKISYMVVKYIETLHYLKPVRYSGKVIQKVS